VFALLHETVNQW